MTELDIGSKSRTPTRLRPILKCVRFKMQWKCFAKLERRESLIEATAVLLFCTLNGTTRLRVAGTERQRIISYVLKLNKKEMAII